MTAAHRWGRPAGPPDSPWNHHMASIPGGITLTTISGGAIDISNAADGSDNIKDITVAGGADLLGGDTVTWATSDAVFAALIAKKINEKAAEHSHWATIGIGATDHVLVWPQDGTAQDTGAIAVDDTSFSASVENMNSEQAFAAATRVPSRNYGINALPDTKMYQVNFDFDYLGSTVNDNNIENFSAVHMNVYPTASDVYFHMGAEGDIYVPSGAWKSINVKAAALGLVKMFVQASAATNLAFDFGGY